MSVSRTKSYRESQLTFEEEISSVIIEGIVSNVHDTLSENQITIARSSMMLIIQIVMEKIEMSDLNGPQKKELAITIIRALINEATIEDEDKKACLTFIDSGFLENTIELIVSASRGQININAAEDLTVGCIQTCFSLLKTRKSKK